jgi:hypothetical protein
VGILTPRRVPDRRLPGIAGGLVVVLANQKNNQRINDKQKKSEGNDCNRDSENDQ